MEPILIVANRLPVAVTSDGVNAGVVDANGGLATGLGAWHAGHDALWVGWPGEVAGLDEPQQHDLEAALEQRSCAAVDLPPAVVQGYYHGFANRVLWPLFHYLIDRVPADAGGWDAYVAANAAFADAVVRRYVPGQRIWVHDYHLMLAPAMLRARLPDARIGFFLHVPFPSSEVFRTLPWRHALLEGLLGADLIGFHTFSYLRHFIASLLHVAGVEPDVDCVRWQGRDVRLGVFPMGIDAQRFTNLASSPEVRARAAAIREDAGGRRLILGIDRLDYTKGIPRRLQSLERVFTDHPDLRDRVRYIQVAVPSREGTDAYQGFRRDVEQAIGRINGACATVGSTPVHYLYRAVTPQELVALYCAADVMLVTPLRDGMNLVAKEFVASRINDDGVLILSEFAGAASELGDALIVNPYDVDALAAALVRAVHMPAEEQRTRMQHLRRRVCRHTVDRWADEFLATLDDPGGEEARMHRPATIGDYLDAARLEGAVHVLLDYDGTVVPLAQSPELAAPDEPLLQLLSALAASPRVHLQIVSGRPWHTLQQWFGSLPIALWAEHGFWHRPAGGERWQPVFAVPHRWSDRVGRILEQFAGATPGAWVERKTASLGWHYRVVEPEFGARQAHELRMLLDDALSNQPLEVLEGHKIIEVRLRGVSKAIVGQRLVQAGVPPSSIVAFGDDRTDEELFGALPPDSITIAVGRRLAGARFTVEDHQAVRAVLTKLVGTVSPLDPMVRSTLV
jgi:trehalose 6-phosphate synthase/phosphatase